MESILGVAQKQQSIEVTGEARLAKPSEASH